MSYTKKKTGRPTTYSNEVLKQTREYITNYEDHGHVIPSIAGLAFVLGVGRSTLYDWANREENKEFSYTLERLNALQECTLLNNGLIGRFNSTITKLALGNHGYSDKQNLNQDKDDDLVEAFKKLADVLPT